MAQQLINVGTTANDGTGDLLRNGFIKVNQNFTELYTNRISGSGTDNYIPRFNGTNALENSIIYDNGTNVGIGTASPSSLLEIAGSAPILTMNRTSGSFVNTIDFKTSGSSVASIISNAGNGEQRYSIGPSVGWGGFHTFYTDTNERMRITSAGNVGIGTSNPEVKLDIYGTGTTQHRIQSSSGGDIRFSVDSVGRLGTYSNSDFLLLSNGTERMRINSSGNVGIGTTNPTEKLHVAGVAQILDDGARGRITFQISSTQNDLYSTTTAFDDYRNLRLSSNELILSSGGTTERMRITSAGNVGIGTTTPFSNAKLQIRPSSDVNIAFQPSNGLSNGGKINAFDDAASVNVNLEFNGLNLGFKTNESERMRITSAGNVGIGTSSPSEKLTLSGGALRLESATGVSSYVHYISPGNDEWSAGMNGAYDFQIAYSNGLGTPRMTLLKGGNVGIGTTSPNNKLDVNGNINVPSTNFYRYDGDTGLIGSATSIVGGASNQLGIRASNDILFATNGANERMRITSGGNVGIGTSSPSAKLDVNGTLNVGSLSSGSNAVISLANNASGGTRNIYYKSSDVTINITSTGGNDLMTITNGGNVGIGTTSPTSKLQVVGLPSYADNTTALAGGLTAGAFYHTAGVLKVVI
jgi:hypothetical protein